MSIHLRAAAFAAGYGTLALLWTVLGRGYPYGPDDPGHNTSVLRWLDPAVGAPLLAAMLLITAVLLLVMHGPARPPGPARLAMLGWLGAVVVALVIVVPDSRVLTLAGYAPILIIGAPFGWPDVDYSTVFTWQLGNQVVSLAGGLLIALAALRWQRRTAGTCEKCGRGDQDHGWMSPAAAARWGRWAVGVAAAVPAAYAVTRLAWLAHIPLGVSDEMLADLHRGGAVWAGAGLGAFALVGAWLTVGLVRPWGERLFGRRVPIKLATVPASLVAVAVTAASVGLLGQPETYDGGMTMAHIPMLLWPLWGAALGAAAYAYHLRRRPACPLCGRGPGPDRGLVPAPAAGAY